MRISDWSSDVCSSDLAANEHCGGTESEDGDGDGSEDRPPHGIAGVGTHLGRQPSRLGCRLGGERAVAVDAVHGIAHERAELVEGQQLDVRSEEHTSELQSLMRISYAVFCLKKKNMRHISSKTYEDSHVLKQQLQPEPA